MPWTAELAIQLLFDLWEERKKTVCPWMGGTWSVLRCSPRYERLRSYPTLINLRSGSIIRHVCIVHTLSMILKCSSKVLVVFCHPLSLVKKLAERQTDLFFCLFFKKQKPPWTSTSVQRGYKGCFPLLQKYGATSLLSVWGPSAGREHVWPDLLCICRSYQQGWL